MRWVLAAVCWLSACSGNEGTRIRMDFDRPDFYTAPFPSEDLRTSDGTIDLTGFPNPDRIQFVDDVLVELDGRARGFSTTSAIYFSLTGPVSEDRLPTYQSSLEPDSPVFLISVDSTSLDHLVRYPIEVSYEEDGGPFGTQHQLSLLPLQGIPLSPGTLYAAVVMREIGDADGEPLAVSATMRALAAGEETGIPALEQARAVLTAEGVELDEVAGMTAFVTQSTTSELGLFVAHAQSLATPTINAAFTQTDVFGGYCVYQTTIDMPVYQQGDPPFTTGGGGGWPAEPAVQTYEESRLVVTIPRSTAPVDGYPTVVMIRTGGGGDRPLVDRGVRDHEGEETEAGGGPARYFAEAGFAGVSVDGPHGGLRNITDGDEQFLIFNIGNPAAMRDNIRQSALELTLLPAILDEIGAIDLADCTGASIGETTFDTSRLALMGHSMGATIAPLVLAKQPAFGAAILSGAGGSWIENIVHKLSPFEIRPLAESMLAYPEKHRSLHDHDPALSLLQWAGEAADPPVYGPEIIGRANTGRHVLMFQGIVDTYILPPMANATSLSLGLDLAGGALDEDHQELADFTPLLDLLPLVGRGQIELPASGNLSDARDNAITGVVVQHPEDAVEDGHEIMFQTAPPKLQYRSFLQSWLTGIPTVPAPE